VSVYKSSVSKTVHGLSSPEKGQLCRQGGLCKFEVAFCEAEGSVSITMYGVV